MLDLLAVQALEFERLADSSQKRRSQMKDVIHANGQERSELDSLSAVLVVFHLEHGRGRFLPDLLSLGTPGLVSSGVVLDHHCPSLGSFDCDLIAIARNGGEERVSIIDWFALKFLQGACSSLTAVLILVVVCGLNDDRMRNTQYLDLGSAVGSNPEDSDEPVGGHQD
ncbi:hypothetical protein Tco_0067035 [Tanacetum coccineum]